MNEDKVYNITVGRRLKRARRYLGITQARMAEELNICEETLRRMEQGVIGVTAEKLEHLHSVYNINPEYIVLGICDRDILSEVKESLLSCEDKETMQKLGRDIINDVMNVLSANDVKL